MLGGYFDGSLQGHQWLVAELDERIVGGAYFAPEPFGDRVWNLSFLAAAPEAQGEGVGTGLLHHVEARLREMGPAHARVLLVETSSIETYSRTRAFYRGLGFVEESRIREFYGTGDDKVTFWKSLTA